MMKKLICIVAAMVMLCAGAQAASIKQAWMEYEDYSGARAEQQVEDFQALGEIENILLRARDNPDQLDGCTQNCTLFVMTEDGSIYDFACATDGCPFIQSGADGKVYNLGVDYQRFWEIFGGVKTGMGFDASDVFEW